MADDQINLQLNIDPSPLRDLAQQSQDALSALGTLATAVDNLESAFSTLPTHITAATTALTAFNTAAQATQNAAQQASQGIGSSFSAAETAVKSLGTSFTDLQSRADNTGRSITSLSQYAYAAQKGLNDFQTATRSASQGLDSVTQSTQQTVTQTRQLHEAQTALIAQTELLTRAMSGLEQATNKVSPGMATLAGHLQNMQGLATGMGAAFGLSAGHIGTAGSAIAGFVSGVNPAAAGAIALSAAVVGLGESFVQTTMHIEYQKKIMESLFEARGQKEAFEPVMQALDGLREKAALVGANFTELQEGYRRLYEHTGNAKESMDLMNAAMQTSMVTGRDLPGVVNAIGSAMEGQFRALRNVGIHIDANTAAYLRHLPQAQLQAEIAEVLTQKFGSQSGAMETTEARYKALGVQWERFQQSTGELLITPLENVIKLLKEGGEAFDSLGSHLAFFGEQIEKSPIAKLVTDLNNLSHGIHDAGKSIVETGIAGVGDMASGLGSAVYGALTPAGKAAADKYGGGVSGALGAAAQAATTTYGAGDYDRWKADQDARKAKDAGAVPEGGQTKTEREKQWDATANELLDVKGEYQTALREEAHRFETEHTKTLEAIREQKKEADRLAKEHADTAKEELRKEVEAHQDAMTAMKNGERDRHQDAMDDIKDREKIALDAIKNVKDAENERHRVAMESLADDKKRDDRSLATSEKTELGSLGTARETENTSFDLWKQAHAEKVRLEEEAVAHRIRDAEEASRQETLTIERTTQTWVYEREKQKQADVDRFKVAITELDKWKRAEDEASTDRTRAAETEHRDELRRIDDRTRAREQEIQEEIRGIDEALNKRKDSQKLDDSAYAYHRAQEELAKGLAAGDDPLKIEQLQRNVFKADEKMGNDIVESVARINKDILKEQETGIKDQVRDEKQAADDKLKIVKDTEEAKKREIEHTYLRNKELLDQQIKDTERAAAEEVHLRQVASQTQRDQIALNLKTFQDAEKDALQAYKNHEMEESAKREQAHRAELGRIHEAEGEVHSRYDKAKKEIDDWYIQKERQEKDSHDKEVVRLDKQAQTAHEDAEKEREEEGSTHKLREDNLNSQEREFNRYAESKRRQIATDEQNARTEADLTAAAQTKAAEAVKTAHTTAMDEARNHHELLKGQATQSIAEWQKLIAEIKNIGPALDEAKTHGGVFGPGGFHPSGAGSGGVSVAPGGNPQVARWADQVAAAARAAGIPDSDIPQFVANALGIMQNESGGDPNRPGDYSKVDNHPQSIGLFQIHEVNNVANRENPAVNIPFGVQKLAAAWQAGARTPYEMYTNPAGAFNSGALNYPMAQQQAIAGTLAAYAGQYSVSSTGALQVVGTNPDRDPSSERNSRVGFSPNPDLQAIVPSQRAYANPQTPGGDPNDGWNVCGPVAAVAFWQAYGRFPNISEAEAIKKAADYGSDPNRNYYTPGQGMHGAKSEQMLIQGVAGVQTSFEPGRGDEAKNRAIAEVQAGRPAIISVGSTKERAGHYYVVTGYNDQTGQFYAGETGQVMKGENSDWLTWGDMGSHGSGIQGVIYAPANVPLNPQFQQHQGGEAPDDGSTDMSAMAPDDTGYDDAAYSTDPLIDGGNVDTPQPPRAPPMRPPPTRVRPTEPRAAGPWGKGPKPKGARAGATGTTTTQTTVTNPDGSKSVITTVTKSPKIQQAHPGKIPATHQGQATRSGTRATQRQKQGGAVYIDDGADLGDPTAVQDMFEATSGLVGETYGSDVEGSETAGMGLAGQLGMGIGQTLRVFVTNWPTGGILGAAAGAAGLVTGSGGGTTSGDPAAIAVAAAAANGADTGTLDRVAKAAQAFHSLGAMVQGDSATSSVFAPGKTGRIGGVPGDLLFAPSAGAFKGASGVANIGWDSLFNAGTNDLMGMVDRLGGGAAGGPVAASRPPWLPDVNHLAPLTPGQVGFSQGDMARKAYQDWLETYNEQVKAINAKLLEGTADSAKAAKAMYEEAIIGKLLPALDTLKETADKTRDGVASGLASISGSGGGGRGPTFATGRNIFADFASYLKYGGAMPYPTIEDAAGGIVPGSETATLSALHLGYEGTSGYGQGGLSPGSPFGPPVTNISGQTSLGQGVGTSLGKPGGAAGLPIDPNTGTNSARPASGIGPVGSGGTGGTGGVGGGTSGSGAGGLGGGTSSSGGGATGGGGSNLRARPDTDRVLTNTLHAANDAVHAAVAAGIDAGAAAAAPVRAEGDQVYTTSGATYGTTGNFIAGSGQLPPPGGWGTLGGGQVGLSAISSVENTPMAPGLGGTSIGPFWSRLTGIQQQYPQFAGLRPGMVKDPASIPPQWQPLTVEADGETHQISQFDAYFMGVVNLDGYTPMPGWERGADNVYRQAKPGTQTNQGNIPYQITNMGMQNASVVDPLGGYNLMSSLSSGQRGALPFMPSLASMPTLPQPVSSTVPVTPVVPVTINLNNNVTVGAGGQVTTTLTPTVTGNTGPVTVTSTGAGGTYSETKPGGVAGAYDTQTLQSPVIQQVVGPSGGNYPPLSGSIGQPYTPADRPFS